MRHLLISRPLIMGLSLCTCLGAITPSVAQDRPRSTQNSQGLPRPALDLKARDIRTDRAAVSDKSLTIARLDVSVKIASGLAETTLEARFVNPNDAILEGDFTLDLPREAWVTGFALDINGTLVDGVLQPKAKAAEAYEENLRRGVDPGLGEITAANQFRTRIFPINARSGRTIKITYVSALTATNAYVLPLTTVGAVEQMSLTITNQGTASPTIAVPRGLSVANGNSASEQTGYTRSSYQAQNVLLQGELRISNVGREADITLMTSSNSDQYFTFITPPAPIAAAKPRIIRLYWDASRSRRGDDLTKEISLLERYVDQVQPQRLDLILFADGAPRTISLNSASLSTLAAQLRGVRYQGASRFGELEGAGQGDADVCLLFSDGQLTLDAFTVRRWPCRVMTISSSSTVRRDILEGIASTNRGVFIDLKTASLADALSALQSRGPDLLALETSSGVAVEYAVTSLADGTFRVTGLRPDSDDLVVKTYGVERRMSLRTATITTHNGAAVLWGASQIRRLSATDNADSDALLAAVRRYGVATPDYSYVVLETVEDYARNNIAPAASIGKVFLAAYQARRIQLETEDRAAKEARFNVIMTQWSEQKTWWKTRFAPQTYSRSNDSDNQPNAPIRPEALIERSSPSSSLGARPPLPPPVPPPQRDDIRTHAPTQAHVSEDRERIRVTGQSRGGAQQPAPSATPNIVSPPASTITITSAVWNPNRPYLTALRDVKSGDEAAFEAIYAAQDVRYGDTPAFYFDMAEWAHRNGLMARAAGIARNALELSTTSIETRIILASRLVRYGDYRHAIWLNERILQATPNKPQALRNLALSIVDATRAGQTSKSIDIPAAIAAYQRALALLMKIVLTPNNGDYDGIELIALMEANHIVATLKMLGVSDAALAPQIDRRLMSLLAVDIRVTLEWNTDKTDMDLWVDEPSGERAIFNNPRTAMGGRLSNDMTRGYGPEEYLLTVAPDGLYKVLSNAYAADRLNPNGPTSLTVKLYRDWGRPTEQVESFVVELNRGEQNNTTEVGRFEKRSSRERRLREE